MDMGTGDMGGDMGGSTNSSGEMVAMMALFNIDTNTPLYSIQWTPTTTGGYAGTCIFLIILAVIFRGFLALKSWQESRWLDAELKRRYVVVSGKLPMSETLSRDSLAKEAVLSENGVEENVMVVKKTHGIHRPWRLSVDPIRAFIDTVIAGLGYLLFVSPPPPPCSLVYTAQVC